MANNMKIDLLNGVITMDRIFANNCKNPYSQEFKKLQEILHDFPNLRIVKKTIKPNPKKETYRGLTYDFMERYLLSHGTTEEITNNFKEYKELRLISECHSKGHRYPVIKSWFLHTFPEIVEFGIHEDLVVSKTSDIPENSLLAVL